MSGHDFLETVSFVLGFLHNSGFTGAEASLISELEAKFPGLSPESGAGPASTQQEPSTAGAADKGPSSSGAAHTSNAGATGTSSSGWVKLQAHLAVAPRDGLAR